MSKPELHAMPLSPPSRAVHMALDLLNLDYTYIPVDLMGGANRTPEFLSLNPQHTVPVLVDGDHVVTESRAALTYLVTQHKPGPLYPACPKKRSLVDQRLYFNMGTFYRRLADAIIPVGFGKTSTVTPEQVEALKEALMWANQMTSCGFVLGGAMTIADVDFMATMSTLEACDFVDLSPYKNLTKWSARMKSMIPHYEENCGKGATQIGDWFKANYKP